MTRVTLEPEVGSYLWSGRVVVVLGRNRTWWSLLVNEPDGLRQVLLVALWGSMEPIPGPAGAGLLELAKGWQSANERSFRARRGEREAELRGELSGWAQAFRALAAAVERA